MRPRAIRTTIALLLSPIGLLLISSVRLLIISDYNTTTATTVASSGGYFNTLLGTAIPLVPVFIPYIALLLLLFRRHVLSIMAFAATALIAPTPLALPVTLTMARTEGHQILARATSNWLLTIVVVIAFVIITGSVRSALFRDKNFLRTLSTAISIAVATALFPYLYDVYPVPRTDGYYAEILREPWLPAEQIAVSSGRTYYGYTLSTSPGWFTVLLLSSRTINYIPAGNVTARTVCQVKQPHQLKQYSPLIPLLHTAPAHIPQCPYLDSTTTTTVPRSKATSYLSHGESLNVITSSVHVSSALIISETNAYQHQRLSAGLRAYESLGDWNAPTPVGQRFWYYPPIEP